MNMETAMTQFNKGTQFLEEGLFEEAIASFHIVIELEPNQSWAYHYLGEALARLGKLEEAVTAYRKAVELKPDFCWSYHHLGDVLERQQQWEGSIIAFRQAIELNPEHFGSYLGLGKSLEKLGQLDEAITAYRRASELDPEADWMQYRLGELLQQRTQLDLEGAIASYRRAIELNPDDVQAYRKLLQIQPDNLEVWLQLGKVLIKLEQWEEAITPYRRLTELNPDDVQAHYRLGELLIKQGDLEGAIDTLRHSLELSPKSDESYYNLGEALAAQGNATEASLCYYKAFKLNPNNMQANQKRPRIYDCFAFFNELDVLRIRIEELKDVVDKFILVEATKTFSGNPKPLYYQEFIHEFAEYQDKIIHYVVDDMPEIDYSQPIHLQAWPLDVHQKNCISRVLNSLECKNEDIILVNDCDEIPRKEKLSEAIELLKDNEFVIFVQDLYHGHLDNLFSEWWCGTVACKYKDFKVRTYTKVRYSDKINTGLDMGEGGYKRSGYINSDRYFEHPYIVKSGWSFSWFGSELSRRYKLQSFAHKEGDDSQARGIEKIKYDVCRPSLEIESSGEFYFDVRDIEGKDVPEFLRNNILKYRHFLQPRQTELMAKIGGDFKQVETQLYLLKKETIKVKEQLEKGMQNLLKVCDILAEKGELVEAIAQWQQLVELYPKFTSNKCFLSNLDGIKNWRINPEDFTLISGQLVQTQAGKQLVIPVGNYGQVCYGPYISLLPGLYRVKIALENADFSGIQGNGSEQLWFKFDVAVNKGWVVYEENVCLANQKEHEFFIDFACPKDLEVRFWATGQFFAVNFLDLTLIHQSDSHKNNEIYEKNWNHLNQPEDIEEYRPDHLTETEPEAAFQYFQIASKYRSLLLQFLTEDDKKYLENLGLSLENLQLIAQDNFALEESYINSFEEDLQKKLIPEINFTLPYQQVLVETGYIYSVCPFSGKVIRSNQSFVINHQEIGHHDLQGFIYRFVGSEIFYLMHGCPMGEKLLIYLPKQELIINFSHVLVPFARPEQSINKFKSYMVSYWSKVKYYLENSEKKVVDVVGLGFNIGHYLWQDMAAIDSLYKSGILSKVDKFLIGPGEYFSIGDVFPEILPGNLTYVNDVWDVFKTVVDNNYVAFRANARFIEESLINRICDVSFKKCTPDCLKEMERAKECFPLLGVQIRTSSRVWLGQVEGIANIINSLYSDFPNLGVVFDGWSLSGKEDSLSSSWSMIESEKAVMAKILSVIDPAIATFSAIGATTYETVVWAKAIDLHISPVGAGLIYPSWIANKPGVLHAHTQVLNYQDVRKLQSGRSELPYFDKLIPQVFIPNDSVVDYADCNYDCDWKVIYNEAVKLIEKLSKDR